MCGGKTSRPRSVRPQSVRRSEYEWLALSTVVFRLTFILFTYGSKYDRYKVRNMPSVCLKSLDIPGKSMSIVSTIEML